MQTEIEVKFLDINADELRKKLKDLGAVLEYAEILMKRKNFDYPDCRLDQINAWLRVRDEGNKVTLSYKRLDERTLYGTKELDVEVNNFDNACALLETIGLQQKSYQETKRELWILDDCQVSLDTWPWIPSFVEIEGSSKEKVKAVANNLGFDWDNGLHGSVEIAYKKYYDVTEAEVNSCPEITFSSVPNWLMERKNS